MPDLPINSAGLETYDALKAKFNIQLTGHINFHLEQFEVFKSYFAVNLKESYVIKQANNDCYVLFVETHAKIKDTKGLITDHYECQTWALAFLKQDFGRVMIRTETLADKLIELVHPIELDFAEDKAFSDTFYVLVNDHQKAVTGINRNFRNAVMDVRADNFIIEIVDHTLVIGTKKSISPDKALHLAEFVARLASMC
ncbi:MAG TPA: hypothetical protein VGC01_11495 [Mucilaginibacter sp.]